MTMDEIRMSFLTNRGLPEFLLQQDEDFEEEEEEEVILGRGNRDGFQTALPMSIL